MERLSNFFRLIAVAFVAYLILLVSAVIDCARLFSGLGTGVYFGRKRPFDLFSPGKALMIAAALGFLLRATVCAPNGADHVRSAAVAAADSDAYRLLRVPLARTTDERAQVEVDSS